MSIHGGDDRKLLELFLKSVMKEEYHVQVQSMVEGQYNLAIVAIVSSVPANLSHYRLELIIKNIMLVVATLLRKARELCI